MAKSPEEMAQSMIDNMPAKTGKSLGEWLEIVATTDLQRHGQIVKFLKVHHSVTHGFANLVAHKALEAASGATPDLLTAQYEKKPDLRTIYDAVVATVGQFGEAEVSVKKTYVSVRRNKQFAILQPSTKTRFDVGINLKGTEATDRLEPSGSFNGMVSHRVRLHSLDEVDAELIGWLKEAYELA